MSEHEELIKELRGVKAELGRLRKEVRAQAPTYVPYYPPYFPPSPIYGLHRYWWSDTNLPYGTYSTDTVTVSNTGGGTTLSKLGSPVTFGSVAGAVGA